MQYQEKKSKTRRSTMVSLLLCLVAVIAICLIACGTTELEERYFPMLVAVGYEDGKVSYVAAFSKQDETQKAFRVVEKTFEESKTKYEGRLNKDADYNHLKVLVFEDDFLENASAYEEMLYHLAKTEDFPRNTYVCAVEDVDDLLELEKNVEQDLGTYLEEYLKQKEEKKDRLLTLGDLLDERVNQSMVLYMPYLEIEDKFVEWKGYMNTFGKSWKESD